LDLSPYSILSRPIEWDSWTRDLSPCIPIAIVSSAIYVPPSIACVRATSVQYSVQPQASTMVWPSLFGFLSSHRVNKPYLIPLHSWNFVYFRTRVLNNSVFDKFRPHLHCTREFRGLAPPTFHNPISYQYMMYFLAIKVLCLSVAAAAPWPSKCRLSPVRLTTLHCPSYSDAVLHTNSASRCNFQHGQPSGDFCWSQQLTGAQDLQYGLYWYFLV